MDNITRKSLLYKSQVEYGDFCINHIEGCAHGCKFPCYAMLLKKRCGVIRDYQDWLKPKLVSNAIELLIHELPKYKSRIQRVHLCFSSDPFMYGYPQVKEMSLRIIEELKRNNIRAVILTKGVLPATLAVEDLYGAENEYGITLVSLNEGFRQDFEPYTAPYSERISALRFLHSRGLRTWISIEPYPTPNIIEQKLRDILDEVAFVDKIVFGKMNYNPLINQYMGWKPFYEECTSMVIEYCQRLNIDLHIKRGTSRIYDESKKILIREEGEGVKLPIMDCRSSLFE
jgi:DNA repair photolyase